ncbi:MAG: hypothetical protein HQL59_10575, partial [Magnetococcales bacterium]|nr:hypothetical protein [Magnetococcales bacterium]
WGHPEAGERAGEKALEELLALGEGARRGLLEPGGVLTPQGLGLIEPLPEKARLLFARSCFRQGRWDAVRSYLRGTRGEESEGMRLDLLALRQGEPGWSSLEILGRLAVAMAPVTSATGVGQSAGLRAAFRALWTFSRQREEAPQAEIRAFLTGYEVFPPVARGLRYHEARRMEREGDLAGALRLYLRLAFDDRGGAISEREADRFLPEPAIRAVVRLLSALGERGEAENLSRSAVDG